MPPCFTPARRVNSFDEIEQAGDYYLGEVVNDETSYKQLWFLLPTHKGVDKFTADVHSGLHGIGERLFNGGQGWTFVDHEDGSLSAEPSIGCGTPPYYWHGYLRPGNVWEEV